MRNIATIPWDGATCPRMFHPPPQNEAAMMRVQAPETPEGARKRLQAAQRKGRFAVADFRAGKQIENYDCDPENFGIQFTTPEIDLRVDNLERRLQYAEVQIESLTKSHQDLAKAHQRALDKIEERLDRTMLARSPSPQRTPRSPANGRTLIPSTTKPFYAGGSTSGGKATIAREVAKPKRPSSAPTKRPNEARTNNRGQAAQRQASPKSAMRSLSLAALQNRAAAAGATSRNIEKARDDKSDPKAALISLVLATEQPDQAAMRSVKPPEMLQERLQDRKDESILSDIPREESTIIPSSRQHCVDFTGLELMQWSLVAHRHRDWHGVVVGFNENHPIVRWETGGFKEDSIEHETHLKVRLDSEAWARVASSGKLFEAENFVGCLIQSWQGRVVDRGRLRLFVESWTHMTKIVSDDPSRAQHNFSDMVEEIQKDAAIAGSWLPPRGSAPSIAPIAFKTTPTSPPAKKAPSAEIDAFTQRDLDYPSMYTSGELSKSAPAPPPAGLEPARFPSPPPCSAQQTHEEIRPHPLSPQPELPVARSSSSACPPEVCKKLDNEECEHLGTKIIMDTIGVPLPPPSAPQSQSTPSLGLVYSKGPPPPVPQNVSLETALGTPLPPPSAPQLKGPPPPVTPLEIALGTPLPPPEPKPTPPAALQNKELQSTPLPLSPSEQAKQTMENVMQKALSKPSAPTPPPDGPPSREVPNPPLPLSPLASTEDSKMQSLLHKAPPQPSEAKSLAVASEVDMMPASPRPQPSKQHSTVPTPSPPFQSSPQAPGSGNDAQIENFDEEPCTPGGPRMTTKGELDRSKQDSHASPPWAAERSNMNAKPPRKLSELERPQAKQSNIDPASSQATPSSPPDDRQEKSPLIGDDFGRQLNTRTALAVRTKHDNDEAKDPERQSKNMPNNARPERHRQVASHGREQDPKTKSGAANIIFARYNTSGGTSWSFEDYVRFQRDSKDPELEIESEAEFLETLKEVEASKSGLDVKALRNLFGMLGTNPVSILVSLPLADESSPGPSLTSNETLTQSPMPTSSTSPPTLQSVEKFQASLATVPTKLARPSPTSSGPESSECTAIGERPPPSPRQPSPQPPKPVQSLADMTAAGQQLPPPPLPPAKKENLASPPPSSSPPQPPKSLADMMASGQQLPPPTKSENLASPPPSSSPPQPSPEPPKSLADMAAAGQQLPPPPLPQIKSEKLSSQSPSSSPPQPSPQPPRPVQSLADMAAAGQQLPPPPLPSSSPPQPSPQPPRPVQSLAEMAKVSQQLPPPQPSPQPPKSLADIAASGQQLPPPPLPPTKSQNLASPPPSSSPPLPPTKSENLASPPPSSSPPLPPTKSEKAPSPPPSSGIANPPPTPAIPPSPPPSVGIVNPPPPPTKSENLAIPPSPPPSTGIANLSPKDEFDEEITQTSEMQFAKGDVYSDFEDSIP